MMYFEGPSVESDLTPCFIVEQREGIDSVYAATESLYLPFSTLDLYTINTSRFRYNLPQRK